MWEGGDEIETQERAKTKKTETGERERVDFKTTKRKEKKQEEQRRKEMINDGRMRERDEREGENTGMTKQNNENEEM